MPLDERVDLADRHPRELADLDKAAANLKILIRELEEKIHTDFEKSFRIINGEFNKYFRLMFDGGKAKLVLRKRKATSDNLDNVESPTNQEENIVEPQTADDEKEIITGVEVELNLPGKKISSLDMLSGGEKSLVSLAALFALISVSAPPFLVLDEIDAALDEENARRFAGLIKEISQKTQFIIVTHNPDLSRMADRRLEISDGQILK